MYVLVLKHEVGLSLSKSTKKMLIDISCDTEQFDIGQIIPVVIKSTDVYKITEAKIIDLGLFSITLELHIRPGQIFHPLFDIQNIEPIFIDTNDYRTIPDYLSYESLKCLYVGSRYRR